MSKQTDGKWCRSFKRDNHEAVFQRKKLQDPFRCVSLAHQTEAPQQARWNPALLDGALFFSLALLSSFLFFLQEEKDPGWPLPSSFPYQSCRAECVLKQTGFAKQHSPWCSGLLWSLPDTVSDHCFSCKRHNISMNRGSAGINCQFAASEDLHPPWAFTAPSHWNVAPQSISDEPCHPGRCKQPSLQLPDRYHQQILQFPLPRVESKGHSPVKQTPLAESF